MEGCRYSASLNRLAAAAAACAVAAVAQAARVVASAVDAVGRPAVGHFDVAS